MVGHRMHSLAFKKQVVQEAPLRRPSSAWPVSTTSRARVGHKEALRRANDSSTTVTNVLTRRPARAIASP